MPRCIRIQTAGASYHVMARGDRREEIFQDDGDGRFFLHAVGQACDMTGWRVHAGVLIGNHYYLFIQAPEPNPVAGIPWLRNSLTRCHNVRHRKWRRSFGDRYKAVIVQGDDSYYYQNLIDEWNQTSSGKDPLVQFKQRKMGGSLLLSDEYSKESQKHPLDVRQAEGLRHDVLRKPFGAVSSPGCPSEGSNVAHLAHLSHSVALPKLPTFKSEENNKNKENKREYSTHTREPMREMRQMRDQL